MTNGCQYNKKDGNIVQTCPEGISSHSGDEKHAVRCCNEMGDECISPEPCQLQSTYQEAKQICHQNALRLCTGEEMLDNICCQKGCAIDCKYTWVDDNKGKRLLFDLIFIKVLLK